MRLDPRVVQQQLANLQLTHPELFEDEESWLLAIESETELDEILTTIVRQIEDAKALSDGTLARLEDLKARKDRFGRRIESLRSLAFKMLDAAGLQKRELSEATLSVRKGQPQLVGEPNADNLPNELCKISREPDRTKIKAALNAGQTVPGVTLSNSPPSLSIRIR